MACIRVRDISISAKGSSHMHLSVNVSITIKQLRSAHIVPQSQTTFSFCGSRKKDLGTVTEIFVLPKNCPRTKFSENFVPRDLYPRINIFLKFCPRMRIFVVLCKTSLP